MMKETIRALETGVLPVIGLIAFVIAFLGVLLYVFALSEKSRTSAKNLPLTD